MDDNLRLVKSNSNLTDLQLEHSVVVAFQLLLDLGVLVYRATERTAGRAEIVEEVETCHRLHLLLAVAHEKVGAADYGRPRRPHRRPHHRQLGPGGVRWK